MSRYRLLAEATTPQEIADALNIRRQELGITINELNDVTGFAGGYVGKIFAKGYRKNLGQLSLPTFLEALGCRLVIVADEDPEALPRRMRRALAERTTGARCVGRLKPQVAA